MTNQEALAIKIIKEETEMLACKIAKIIEHCSDCPANDICLGFGDPTCADTIEKWLKTKEGD